MKIPLTSSLIVHRIQKVVITMIAWGVVNLTAQAQSSSIAPSNPNSSQLSSQTLQTFNLKIENGLSIGGPQTIRVSKGSEVILKFSSDTSGVVHLHAYHLELPLSANQEAQLQFTAKASGKFRVEWHPKPSASSTPSNPVAHEGPPLMSLEVMPL
jgi:hypothetical protein